MAKVVKSKCLGCGICSNICPEGIEVVNGKARIKDENADCLKDAANACPQEAILLNEKETEKEDTEFNQNNNENNWKPGIGQGRGLGAGRGRGLGIGPRNGRGRGMGRGRRR
jgi:ferredoxin